MKVRHRECTKLLDTILEINKGVSVENVLKSSFDLSQFKVDMTHIYIQITTYIILSLKTDLILIKIFIMFNKNVLIKINKI